MEHWWLPGTIYARIQAVVNHARWHSNVRGKRPALRLACVPLVVVLPDMAYDWARLNIRRHENAQTRYGVTCLCDAHLPCRKNGTHAQEETCPRCPIWTLQENGYYIGAYVNAHDEITCVNLCDLVMCEVFALPTMMRKKQIHLWTSK